MLFRFQFRFFPSHDNTSGVKKYEYGTKASIVATKDSGVIVGVSSHSKNEHDSKTLELAISSANQTRTTQIKEAICDRG